MAGDKTYITDSNGKLHRATRTHKVTPESIVWSSNPNDYAVQVRIDGKWHRAFLTMDAGTAAYFDNINIDKALVTGGDGKTHTALICSPEASVTMSSIKTDQHSLVAGTTTGETAVNVYSETWSNVQWQDNVNVYKVLVTGSDGKVHTALLTTSVTGGVEVIIKGTSPLVLPDAVNSHISLLKAFGGTKQGVPEGYTRVEYLQADGNQSIPLNITGINKRIEIDAQYTGASASTAKILATYDTNYGATFFGVYSNKWGFTLSNVIGDATTRTLVKCAFTFNSSGYNSATITANDETLTYTRTSTRPNKTLTLFGFSSYRFIGKIYGCQIYDNNTNELLFDGIPAVRDSDSVAGLYDSVSGVFLETTGDEPFSVGPNVIPTPTSPIDIVCNNGAIKVKDSELPVGYRRVLGYACNDDVLWQITDFHLRGSDTVRISFSVNVACNVFGCYQGPDATDNYDLYVSTTSGSKYFRYGSGTYLSYWASSNLGQRFDVVFSPTGTTGMPQDSTWTPLTFESENDLLIGATTLTGSSAKLKGNLYGNIIVDGRLKLIPCERVSDGVLGYFDTYSQTFYEPQGTGTSLGYDDSYIAEVYVDGTTETISVSGQNLIDLTQCIDGYYYTSTGVYTPSNGMKMTDFIPVKANTSYTVYFAQGLSSANVRVNIFDSGKVWQSQETMSVSNATPENVLVITPDIDGYMSVSCLASGTSYGDWATAQVVKGSYTVDTMPEYTPYNHNGTATVENLLSIGDYTDEHEVISGQVTRKIGIRVLKGTESWIANSSNVYSFGLNGALRPTASPQRMAIPCTHFVGTDATNASMPNNSIKQGSFAAFPNDGGIGVKMTSVGNVSGFKQWLADQYAAGTPVIIAYVLKNSTTERVAGQHLNTVKGDNTVEITQASIGGLELEAQYRAAVELTIQEAEDANLDNNVTVTIQ